MRRETIRMIVLIVASVVILSLIIFKLNLIRIHNCFIKEHMKEMTCNGSLLTTEEMSKIEIIAITRGVDKSENKKSVNITKLGKKLHICPKQISDKHIVFVKPAS